MQLLQTKRRHRRPRWIKVALALVATGLLVAAWQNWDNALARYRHWKQHRALARAKAFIEKRDSPNAQLALEVALRAVPGDPDALRVAADMLEQVGAPQAMRLRRAVVQAQPNSVADIEALVNTCLRFRDFNAARDALASLTPEQARQPAGLRAGLAFALATDNNPVADVLFRQLESSLPGNDDLAVARELLYLRHPQRERRDQARLALEKIAASQPDRRLYIHRQFAANALLRRDYAEAQKWFGEVLKDPAATVTDRLQKANLDLLIDKQPFETAFAQIAPLAAKNEADAAQFAQWMLVQGRVAETRQWLRSLPADLRETAPLKSVQADIALADADWDRLADLLVAEAWGPITKETVRLAMAAHTVDNPNRPSLRRETWELTLDSGRNSLGTLRILQRLATSWGWDEETERTLWTIARAFPDQTWAHQELFNVYRRRKDARSMRDVIATLRESEPSVPRYQHDWALLTLLTEPTGNWNPAKETMRQLYEASPADPTYATGYGFALAQAGKGAEALAVIEKMKPDDRDYPPRQPYLAFIYGVAKRGAELEKAVALSNNPGLNLLPEENYLFTRARSELERKPEKPKAKANPAETGQP